MKKLICILILSVCFLTNIAQTNVTEKRAQLNSGEKIALKLDSIAKAENIKMFSVYFHMTETIPTKVFNKTTVQSFLVEEYSIFRFDGQFIILTDSENTVRYYNLEKLIHFTIDKGKTIRIYFQI